jgi:hypothetical protein
MSTRQCNVCGANNGGDAKFCSHCGAPIGAPVPSPSNSWSTQVSGQPSAPRQSPPPARKSDLNPYRIHGKVQRFQRDSYSVGSGLNKHSWSFVVQEFDNAGNLADTIPVQMEGFRFIGALGDGDEVVIDANRNASHPLHVKKLYNVSRRTVVKPHNPFGKSYILAIPCLLFFLIIFGLALAMILGIWSQFPGIPSFAGSVQETSLTNCRLNVEFGATLLLNPEIGSPILATLSRGSRYTATLKRQGAFTYYQVNADGNVGWVSASDPGVRFSNSC